MTHYLLANAVLERPEQTKPTPAPDQNHSGHIRRACRKETDLHAFESLSCCSRSHWARERWLQRPHFRVGPPAAQPTLPKPVRPRCTKYRSEPRNKGTVKAWCPTSHEIPYTRKRFWDAETCNMAPKNQDPDEARPDCWARCPTLEAHGRSLGTTFQYILRLWCDSLSTSQKAAARRVSRSYKNTCLPKPKLFKSC